LTDIERLDHIEYVISVAVWDGFPVHEPGQEILIAFIDQGLIEIEGGLIHRLNMGVGEPTENQIGLTATAIAAAMNQTLLPGGDRFGHLASWPLHRPASSANSTPETGGDHGCS
jgi:hypothetical protein